MITRRTFGVCFAASVILGAILPAAAIDRDDVLFSITYNTAVGQSVYVVGNIAELGNDNAAYSVKLEPGSYPLWKATIAIPTGLNFTYRYIWRNDAVSQWSNASNQNAIGSPINGSTMPVTACPAAKGFYYHSGWAQPVLFWRQGTGLYTSVLLHDFGPGRGPGERRWRALGIGVAQRDMEFYLTDGGSGRDPSNRSLTYKTTLDAFFLQEGNIYDYTPPPSISSPQQTNFSTFFSTNLGENRPYRVLLPRGYQQNTGKHYPVLYLHDGQNVFDQGPFGTWNADETANSMTKLGQMRETIIVAVDNTANRGKDYTPPDDNTPIGPGSGQPGQADKYAAFLINELKPVIDVNYRTYTDRANTMTVGSSLGGLVALYLGWDFNSVFGRCGPMSGSWQLNNFPARVLADSYRDLRIYLDSGDSGTSNDNAQLCMNLRDGLLRKGYVLERTLRHVVGYGQQHNEAAWAARLPQAYSFLLPATESENPLLAEIFRGDVNCDGDITLADHEALADCLTGPNVPIAPGCARADLDEDGDCDLGDFALFARQLAPAS